MKTLTLFFALGFAALAQTSLGVTLSGPVDASTIENHSDKQLIAALVVLTDANGHPWVRQEWFTNRANQLPDGGSEKVRPFSKHQKLDSPIVAAKINAVIFSDGEFRGEDSYQAGGTTIPANFQSNMERDMQSMRSLWQMAKAGNWAGIKAEADGAGDGNLFAARLIFERDRPGAGEAKAVNLLAHWGLLPASTWKGGR